MSSLHIWFSKLKWSLDVLLRFYERHAFICALHKVSLLIYCLLDKVFDTSWSFQETKLLFDELIFCLQRLYCIPFHLDMPFNSSILEEITTVEVRIAAYILHIIQDQYLTWYPLQVYKRREHCSDCACTRTPTSGSEVSSCQMTLLANFLSFCLHNYMPVKCLNWRVVHFYVMCSASGCNADVNNSLN